MWRTGPPLAKPDPSPVVNDPGIKHQFPASLVMQEAPDHSAAIFQIRDIVTRHVRMAEIPEAIIASNLLVLFDSADNSARIIPDIFVAFGAAEYLASSFRVPNDRDLRMFVVEVLSPSTHEIDKSTKMLSYAEMGAAEYWLFDPTGKLQVTRLRGFRLADGKYVPIPGSGESKEQAVHSMVLSMDLYLDGQTLRLANPATAEEVPTSSALEECWKESKARESGSGEDAPAGGER